MKLHESGRKIEDKQDFAIFASELVQLNLTSYQGSILSGEKVRGPSPPPPPEEKWLEDFSFVVWSSLLGCCCAWMVLHRCGCATRQLGKWRVKDTDSSESRYLCTTSR